MRRAIFLSAPLAWEHGHGPSHPLKPERLRRTVELLNEYGAFNAPNVRVVEPRSSTDDELALFHTLEYIKVVRGLSAGNTRLPAWRYGFGPGDNPVFGRMYETESVKAGSSLVGAAMLVNGECDVAFSFVGGLHHARPEMASGFCVFNDAAIAIHWLLQKGLRVAYVDIDVHHGDGVQAAFYDTDRVLTISLHQDGQTLFPGTGFVDEIGTGAGKGYSVNVPLPPYTDDETYLWAFQQTVPPLLERFKADIVVTQLGVDTHHNDPLAQLALTTVGQTALFEALDRLAPRWLALGGGGYDIGVVPRAWTVAFGIMSGQSFPDELPEQYRARCGGQWLQDRERPQLDESTRHRVQQQVKAVVAEVKQCHNIQ